VEVSPGPLREATLQDVWRSCSKLNRELFIQRTCAFLHKEVKPMKGQPLRSLPLTQELAASQTSDFSSKPRAAHPSANTSHQPFHDVEKQEEDKSSLSLIETQAAVTKSQGILSHRLLPTPLLDHAVPPL
jgi:hypothetical protein